MTKPARIVRTRIAATIRERCASCQGRPALTSAPPGIRSAARHPMQHHEADDQGAGADEDLQRRPAIVRELPAVSANGSPMSPLSTSIPAVEPTPKTAM